MSVPAEACVNCQEPLENATRLTERISYFPFCSEQCAVTFAKTQWRKSWQLCPTLRHWLRRPTVADNCCCTLKLRGNSLT